MRLIEAERPCVCGECGHAEMLVVLLGGGVICRECFDKARNLWPPFVDPRKGTSKIGETDA